MDNEMLMVAMQVIMNSCNGRDKIDEAFQAMAEFDFEKAEKLIAEGEECITEAHRSQTEKLQEQAAAIAEEKEIEVPTLLFIHAQDTLMTSDSQLRVAKNLLPVLKKLASK